MGDPICRPAEVEVNSNLALLKNRNLTQLEILRRLTQAEHTAWNEGECHNEQRKTQTLDTKGGQGKEEIPGKHGWH